jgi:hypothetical protein
MLQICSTDYLRIQKKDYNLKYTKIRDFRVRPVRLKSLMFLVS